MSEAIPLADYAQSFPASEPAEAIPTPEGGGFDATSPSDLQLLIDSPCRALEVEYKGWRNLNHVEDRAELARDIAALANYGGGYIVFGFYRDTLLPEDIYPFWTRCTSEQVSSITHEYLDPPVQCDLLTLRSIVGNTHTIIRVPGHGPTPVCVSRTGPAVGGERLVERGAYYTRKYVAIPSGKYIGVPRGESRRIDGPQDWAPLIRRCVRQERETLLEAFEAIIEGRRSEPTLEQRVRAWHDAAHTAFLALASRSPVEERLRRCHFALSYGFELIGARPLEPAQLPELLRRVVFEQKPVFGGVLNMFDPPYRRAVQARFGTDAATGDGDAEFLEVAWLRERVPTEAADFWRLSPYGLATIVRDYAEDGTTDNRKLGREPATWFSPNLLVQEVAELVCHARILTRFFTGVRRIIFRCEWWGLAGRELFDPFASWGTSGPTKEDHRVVTTQANAAGLTQRWPDVVAQIMGPLIRAFEPDLSLDADWVRTQAEAWQSGPAP